MAYASPLANVGHLSTLSYKRKWSLSTAVYSDGVGVAQAGFLLEEPCSYPDELPEWAFLLRGSQDQVGIWAELVQAAVASLGTVCYCKIGNQCFWFLC